MLSKVLRLTTKLSRQDCININKGRGSLLPFYSKRMITAHDILSKVDQETIMSRYFPLTNIKPFQKVRNPFRTDKNPGCSFYYDHKNRLIFSDPAQKHYTGDCFHICALASDIDLYDPMCFHETLKKVDEDFCLGLYPKTFHRLKSPPTPIISPNKGKLIKMVAVKKEKKTVIKNRYLPDFAQYHMDYWGQYLIKKETLRYFGVRPVFRSYIESGSDEGATIWQTTVRDPIFSYPIPDKDDEFQLYRPKSTIKSKKFRTNATNCPLLGLDKIPYNHPVLFITSSYKDIMVLYEIGIPAVCPIGEATTIDRDVINNLLIRYEEVVVNYDNDIAGLNATDNLTFKHPQLDAWTLDEDVKEKDISDFVKANGLKAAKQLLSEYVYEYNKKAPF